MSSEVQGQMLGSNVPFTLRTFPGKRSLRNLLGGFSFFSFRLNPEPVTTPGAKTMH